MGRKGKAVVVINGRGEVVCAYDNVQEAARINHSCTKSIYLALRKRRYHRKHLWMWEEEYQAFWFEGRIDELRNSYREWRILVAKKGRDGMSPDQKERWRRKLSESKKRRKDKMPDRKQPILCISTGKVYSSQVELARILGVTAPAVSHAVRKGGKVKGLEVKKISKEET